MTKNEILTETSTPEANYEFALTFEGKNYNNMLYYLFKSAEGGYLPAIAKLAELYKSKPLLINRLDEEQSANLNNIACSLITENHNKEDESIAYTLFRVASKKNIYALQSLAYCKFEGIGVRKNVRNAFEILYVNNLNHELTVFSSSKTEGFQYKPKKSKVAKNVKRKLQKKNLLEFIRNLFLWIFGAPALIVFGLTLDTEEKIKGAGGIYVDEDLRSNAIGGFCLMAIVSFLWAYIVCSGISILFFYLIGCIDCWGLGFILGLPLSFLICKIIIDNVKSFFK